MSDQLDPETPWWARLARRAGHPFAHPAWLDTYAREATTGECRWVRVGDPRQPWGLVGLTRAEGVVRFIGNPLADRAGPLCAPDDGPRLTALLPTAVEKAFDVPRTLVGSGVDATWVAGLPGDWKVRTEPAPVVEPRGSTWSEYLDGPGARRRRRIASQAARLLATPGVRVVTHRSPATVAAALGVLQGLHRARFGTASRTFSGVRGRFFARALPALAAQEAASILTLEEDGWPLAAILLLHTPGADWFYQGGWDPGAARRSPGRALFATCLRRAFDNSLRAFHLLRGAEPYKAFWANADAPVALVTSP